MRYQTELLQPEIGAPGGAPLHVRAIGRFRSLGRFRWEQVSPILALHCIHAGTGTMIENGVESRVGPGDLYLFRPGRHYRYHDDAGAPWRYDFLTFAGAAPDAALAAAGLPDPITGPMTMRFRDELAGMCRLYSAPALSLATALRATWCLLERLGTDASPPPQSLAARIDARLDALPALPGVSELARHFGIDRTTLYRRVRAETGRNVSSLIEDRRQERAERLLAQSDTAIAEIADLCGYRHAAYFTMKFRRRTGLSPTAWRARAQAE